MYRKKENMDLIVELFAMGYLAVLICMGGWLYFVNGKEKIIKVNCCEKADGAKYFGCYWEEKVS